MIKILVYVKDAFTESQACAYFGANNFEAVSVREEEKAVELVKKGEADLVLCEADTPFALRLDGARRSGEKESCPVVFITSADLSKLNGIGFRVGVDDIIIRPFCPDELLHRVTAVALRAGLISPDVLIIGKFRMNNAEHTAYQNGTPLPLSVREFNILFRLLSNPKKTFTRSQLMAAFWGFDSSASSRTVDVYMAKIREKTATCEDFEIVTMHGLGYKALLKTSDESSETD